MPIRTKRVFNGFAALKNFQLKTIRTAKIFWHYIFPC